MSFGIPDDFKELVRDRTDLVGLVNETVQLQPTRGGQDHIGICPFHEDHSPSLHVYPDRHGGTYRCWVCQEGGDCFSWVQEIERLTFPEAIGFLAARIGLELPRQTHAAREVGSQKQSGYDILAWVEEQFHQQLVSAPEAQRAREYLYGRGYDDDAIARFRIGYHPDSWTWLLDRARGRYTPQDLLRVRVVAERRESSGYYDYFVNRVIFPIHDERSRTIAFGGRVLPGDDGAKYFNSVESDYFHKSSQLYAFDLARQTIRKTGTVFVVEGYTDCISCHLHGLDNTVATLGTALTEQHVRKLGRFLSGDKGRRVVLIYDGDRAGQDAAERVLGKLLSQEIDLRILTLPAQQDPADLLAHAGADELRRLAAEAPEAIDFKFNRLVARHGTDSVEGLSQVRDEMLKVLAAVPDRSAGSRLDTILGKLARKLGTDEWRVRSRLQELSKQAQSSRPPVSVPATGDETQHQAAAATKAEREILEILFIQPDQLEPVTAEIGAADFENPQLRSLFERILDLNEAGTFDGPESVLNSLDGDLAMKKLTISLTAAGEDKGLHQLIGAEVVPGQPPFVESVVRAIKLRRNERQKELSKHHLSQSNSDLNSDTRDALRQLTQLQLERMRHPSTLK